VFDKKSNLISVQEDDEDITKWKSVCSTAGKKGFCFPLCGNRATNRQELQQLIGWARNPFGRYQATRLLPPRISMFVKQIFVPTKAWKRTGLQSKREAIELKPAKSCPCSKRRGFVFMAFISLVSSKDNCRNPAFTLDAALILSSSPAGSARFA
jgi:hypothetical protein